MNIYESAEDYLERILMLKNTKGSVRSIDIAHDMGYSKPSISRAIKNLREAQFIDVLPGGIIELTEKGYQIASRILERHHLLANLFIKLGVDAKIALEDACKVEHDLSDETFAAIKKVYEKNWRQE